MTAFKVMTIVGTRPEVIRLSRVLAVLNQTTDHVLVHTGQNYDYELNEIFFDDLQIKKPDEVLKINASSPSEAVGEIIKHSEKVMRKHMPDAVLILGDTNSCLAAYAAKRNKIPVFHLEAGNRCFDERVPEEINRKVIDHISDINLSYSSLARDNLIREGLPPDRCIKVGSPLFEVLTHYLPKIKASKILKKLELTKKKYFIVSCHREENIDDDRKFKLLFESLNKIADTYSLPIIFSAHPRTRKKMEESPQSLHKLIRVEKPFGFFDYNYLQLNAAAVLSDSGTITEESAILRFPAVNIRESHERPEGMEEAAVIMSGLDSCRILQALDISMDGSFHSRMQPISDYTIPNVSEKIVRIILSYTDYVNRKVWYEF